MKTIALEVEDTLHEHLMALIEQLPKEKIHIVQTEPQKTDSVYSVDQATDYVLKKNAKLYRRLS